MVLVGRWHEPVMAQVSIFDLNDGLAISSLEGMSCSWPSPVNLFHFSSSGSPEPERKLMNSPSGEALDPKSWRNKASSSSQRSLFSRSLSRIRTQQSSPLYPPFPRPTRGATSPSPMHGLVSTLLPSESSRQMRSHAGKTTRAEVSPPTARQYSSSVHASTRPASQT